MVRDCYKRNPNCNLKLRLIGKRQQDGRTYNLPTTSEVAALIVGDITDSYENRDIIVEMQSGELKRISELHPSYIGLHYPMIFPYGEDCYRIDIPQRVTSSSSTKNLKKCTMREFFAYRIQDRDNKFSLILISLVYTVEFQKRGLPHAHLCLFLHPDHKLTVVENVDQFICAEILDEKEDPTSYSLVKEFTMHGPCWAANLKCSFMIDKRCSKNFPKKFSNATSLDSDGFPIYRRRDSGSYVERYQAHINDEWCNQAGSIKYLFKYINKGPDRATVSVVQNNEGVDDLPEKDEIKEYYDCRYISTCEASWRIFSFDIHYRYPSVMRLPFHLPGQQQVVYEADEDLENVLEKASVNSSMFTSWMDCNQHDDLARQLTYVEFPSKFVWVLKDRKWERRKKGFAVGRIHHVSPSLGEVYFLRVLLNKVKGPRSFDEIKTVNGVIYATFRDACYALGLLDDDSEYIEAIQEASQSGSGFFLRNLFASMLMSNSISRPEFVWEKTWSIYLSLTEEQLKNLTLYEIEKFLLRNNYSLRRFLTMPYPDNESLSSSNNRLIIQELSAIEGDNGGVFFVYGYGGTGKTFL
ncbi:uncharacterized protein LOC143617209 [Bidens hawaiensis]|uniref:uncharacterized protein LOC143617209 n=1 Tax=Bidens hawaiensis TaxID=980011 RepID=UPI00404B3A40